MNIATVADLIEALKQCNPGLPVFKSDPNLNGYHIVNLTDNMTFRIILNCDLSLPVDMVDDFPETAGGFNAVII